MDSAEDSPNPLVFVTTCLALGLPAWVFGNAIERTVGSRGMITRVLVNAVVLYSLFMLIPWSVMSNLQSTLPGVLACGILLNTQRWKSRSL